MKFKTLVLNKGTKLQEFYGHDSDIGWITCGSPIHMMSEDVTFDEVKKVLPDGDWSDVELVTIEINILD